MIAVALGRPRDDREGFCGHAGGFCGYPGG